MLESYHHSTANFTTIIDFLRFGITEANKNNLWYGHGTDNAVDDIYQLVLGSLSLPFDTEIHLLNARVTDEEKAFLAEQLFKRIRQRIPVPYLLNKAYFCGLEFYVDQRVLIPRSPIAELINNQFAPWIAADKIHRVLELCTGSACIAIACSYALPDASIDAVDLSSDALQIAALNCQKHEVSERINLIQSDCWQNVPNIKYDLIVANPPYVGDEEMQSLPAEYLHEPDMALRTTKNGLAITEAILTHAHLYLSDHGILVVEVGNSEQELIALYPELPFTWLDFEHGGQGIFLLTARQLNSFFA